MLRTALLLLVSCSPGLLHAAEADGPPSCEASGMPGAVGTFELKPPNWRGTTRHPHPPGPTTYWIDTDGVDPGTAGCHLEVNSQRRRLVRMFGEDCLNGLLVESNPGTDKLHVHENDLGHPDKFDCNAWCLGKGGAGGSCVTVTLPAPCARSAKCVCT